jgi:hypothetical protein
MGMEKNQCSENNEVSALLPGATAQGKKMVK